MDGFSNVQLTMVDLVAPGQTSIGSGSSHVISIEGSTPIWAEETGPKAIRTIIEAIIADNGNLHLTDPTVDTNG